jgi:hypothetical protein
VAAPTPTPSIAQSPGPTWPPWMQANGKCKDKKMKQEWLAAARAADSLSPSPSLSLGMLTPSLAGLPPTPSKHLQSLSPEGEGLLFGAAGRKLVQVYSPSPPSSLMLSPPPGGLSMEHLPLATAYLLHAMTARYLADAFSQETGMECDSKDPLCHCQRF